ncbi:hypothetical protein PPERSA_02283 [Pseudocohnilembus persalinus]|uniref:MORN motif n=1 Tax=Pseudocohnilembus persalinus TaxID=266149 RepID=A0A0V0QKF8_PSEPJ|nr:hypothetical protein PPERSA_02283 [Pseudocohnilembus persalinus]|eukprot:KRX02793.1 hypothetical protein PPERSA_02283 [Pseudocohnilembus persalinus]
MGACQTACHCQKEENTGTIETGGDENEYDSQNNNNKQFQKQGKKKPQPMNGNLKKSPIKQHFKRKFQNIYKDNQENFDPSQYQDNNNNYTMANELTEDQEYNKTNYQSKQQNYETYQNTTEDSQYTFIQEFPTELHPTVENILAKLGDFDYGDDQEFSDIPVLKSPIIYENGSIYFGQFQDNIKQGKGKQLWADGSLYEGYFLNDQATGKGRLIHSDGDIYFGEWQMDKAHGQGIYLHSDGAQYKGEWYEDLQHGYGEETWTDGTKYEGSYFMGKKHGQGKFQWPDNSSYEGEFQDNIIQGQGHYKWGDERQNQKFQKLKKIYEISINYTIQREYEGEWKNNQMSGFGIFRWPDGRKYEGEYFQDKKQGQGKFIWPDGKVYEGSWENGKQHGYGVMTLKDGTIKRGQWLEGKYFGGDQVSDIASVEVQIQNDDIQFEDVRECFLHHLTREKLRQTLHYKSQGYTIEQGSPEKGMKLIHHFLGIDVEIISEVTQNEVIYSSTVGFLFQKVKYKYDQERKIISKDVIQQQPLIISMISMFNTSRNIHQKFLDELKEVLEFDSKYCYIESGNLFENNQKTLQNRKKELGEINKDNKHFFEKNKNQLSDNLKSQLNEILKLQEKLYEEEFEIEVQNQQFQNQKSIQKQQQQDIKNKTLDIQKLSDL